MRNSSLQILANSLCFSELAVFSHHNYSFNGEVRFQEEGGPIGLEVSGAVGKVVMLAWCREFHTTLPATGGRHLYTDPRTGLDFSK